MFDKFQNNNSNDNSHSHVVKNVTIFGITALATLTLAGCANSSSGSNGSSNTNGSMVAKSSQAITNVYSALPKTLDEFTSDVKAAGFQIIPGRDYYGMPISGATKDSDGNFYVNVKVDNNIGTISIDPNGNGAFIVNFLNLGVASQFGNVAAAYSYVKSQE
jgi:outer membrane murein-binding lipoprotein Lpp